MAFVLGKNIRNEGWIVPYTTFTVWAFTMLLIRHALSAFVIPFVSTSTCNDQSDIWACTCSRLGNLTILIAEAMRLPSLLNAVVVFVVWNLILAPGIYFLAMDTQEKKKQFLRWLFQFNLLNQHGLNLPLAVMSSIVTAPRDFTDVDLYFAMGTLILYLVFYLLVLDRLGVHLYPIFSPRTRHCFLIWVAVALSYYGLFRWVQNYVKESILLTGQS